MIEIAPKLYAVQVPIDSTLHYVEIDHDQVTYYAAWKTEDDYSNICLDRAYEVVGNVTADTIDFDPAPYVPKDHGMLNNIYAFRNIYLDAKGLHFVNEMPKPIPDHYDYHVYMNSNKFELDTEAWQNAENALVKKLLILEKICVE